MTKNRKHLHLKQLDQKLSVFESARQSARPGIGWVRTIRQSLGMSLEQLGKKLGVSKQSVQHLEKREASGSITLNALHQAADALDMELVYGFVPKGGSVLQLVEEKARKMATEIVMRTSHNMRLEDQAVSYQRLEEAITERTNEIMQELPKTLWD
jgi:predicted DNA-binding mobile mystery protein A